MRSGCAGCFTGLALVIIFGLGTAWTVSAVVRAFEVPAQVASVGGQADGARAQRKIYEIVRRPQGTGRAGNPVMLTERELNAFLSRHVDGGLPLESLAVRLIGAGVAELTGQLPLERLMTEPPLRSVVSVVPRAWLDRRVWLRIEARPRVESRLRDPHYLKVDMERAWIGRQRIPTVALKIILSPNYLRALSWPVPGGIDAVNVEPGRLIVKVASAR